MGLRQASHSDQDVDSLLRHVPAGTAVQLFAAGPSSSISPATTIRRFAGMVASASTIASRAFGLEL